MPSYRFWWLWMSVKVLNIQIEQAMLWVSWELNRFFALCTSSVQKPQIYISTIERWCVGWEKYLLDLLCWLILSWTTGCMYVGFFSSLLIYFWIIELLPVRIEVCWSRRYARKNLLARNCLIDGLLDGLSCWTWWGFDVRLRCPVRCVTY